MLANGCRALSKSAWNWKRSLSAKPNVQCHTETARDQERNSGGGDQAETTRSTLKLSSATKNSNRAFDGYGEKVEEPGEVRAALQRGLNAVAAGQVALIDVRLAKAAEMNERPDRAN